jgi:ABC-type multidrug transport system ATPase subunit
MAQPSLALKCEHVVKRYGDLVAVNDVSLQIATGEIFGLVGLNGAGKTTPIEMIESLRTPDGSRRYRQRFFSSIAKCCSVACSDTTSNPTASARRS